MPPADSPLGWLCRQDDGLAYGWLPDDPGAAWQTIHLPPGITAPSRYPRLRIAHAVIGRQGARPRLEVVEPDLVAQTAALVDGAGLPRKRVAELLHRHPDDGLRWGPLLEEAFGEEKQQAIRKRRRRHEQFRAAAYDRVKREHLAAGRRLLHAYRVLPWVGWADGKIPDEWWLEEVFSEGVDWWREVAARWPVRDSEEEPEPIWDRLRRQQREAEDPWPRLIATYERRSRAEDQQRRRLAALRDEPWRFPVAA